MPLAAGVPTTPVVPTGAGVVSASTRSRVCSMSTTRARSSSSVVDMVVVRGVAGTLLAWLGRVAVVAPRSVAAGVDDDDGALLSALRNGVAAGGAEISRPA